MQTTYSSPGGSQGRPDSILLSNETPTHPPTIPEAQDPQRGVILPEKQYGDAIWAFRVGSLPNFFSSLSVDHQALFDAFMRVNYEVADIMDYRSVAMSMSHKKAHRQGANTANHVLNPLGMGPKPTPAGNAGPNIGPRSMQGVGSPQRAAMAQPNPAGAITSMVFSLIGLIFAFTLGIVLLSIGGATGSGALVAFGVIFMLLPVGYMIYKSIKRAGASSQRLRPGQAATGGMGGGLLGGGGGGGLLGGGGGGLGGLIGNIAGNMAGDIMGSIQATFQRTARMGALCNARLDAALAKVLVEAAAAVPNTTWTIRHAVVTVIRSRNVPSPHGSHAPSRTESYTAQVGVPYFVVSHGRDPAQAKGDEQRAADAVAAVEEAYQAVAENDGLPNRTESGWEAPQDDQPTGGFGLGAQIQGLASNMISQANAQQRSRTQQQFATMASERPGATSTFPSPSAPSPPSGGSRGGPPRVGGAVPVTDEYTRMEF